MSRAYNAFKSPPDDRDLKFALPAPVVVPPAFSLQANCGPVRDQGSEGSCTGHAGYAMRMALRNALQNANKKNLVTFSPAEIYWNARLIDGTTDKDAGSCGRSVCQALNKYGACPENDFPYVAGGFASAPSDQAAADALKWRAGAYHVLQSVEQMKECIASGYGFIVGFTVYESFENGDWASNSAMMPAPDKASEQVLGGHEVYFCGYDDAKQAFLVQNSWGTGWGQDGFFWFPYSCAADSDVLLDAYIQHLGKPW